VTARAGFSPTSDVGSLYNTTLMTGARQMWRAGFTGKGVDVALIDTGVAPVKGLIGADKVVYGADLSWESQTPALRYNDSYGHGTHMAGIIAGRDKLDSPAGYATDTSGFLGMAPDARIVSVKTADAHGGTDVTQVIAAIDWVLQHRHDNGMNIRLINLSFGTDSTLLSLNDPLSYAVEQAWAQGIAVVVASGNDGLTSLGLANPARDPYVIAVGAADTRGSNSYSDDRVASFSDYGNLLRDPDLIAPGVHIASLGVPGSYIDQTYGSTGRIDSRLFRGSGTSQAAAVVTGAAALLLQEHPTLNPDQLKGLLTSTADPLSLLTLSLDLSQGHGELDLGRAMRAGVSNRSQWSLLRSFGSGSIELARGSRHIVLGGVPLRGEQDIFGRPVSTPALAALEAQAAAWRGGDWNGSTWTGSTWTGSTWTGSAWTGNSWTGSTWTGSAWTGNSWTGSTWTGSTWTGNSWTGSTWTGSTWTGSTWTGSTWTGNSWTGSTWTGSTWTGNSWTGSTWTGSTWTGSTWTGSTWTGAAWSSAGWS
jgi:serine protease AprX